MILYADQPGTGLPRLSGFRWNFPSEMLESLTSTDQSGERIIEFIWSGSCPKMSTKCGKVIRFKDI